jgi:tetratricopeptide (TPR) repeat protein
MNRRDRRAAAKRTKADPNTPEAGTVAALHEAGFRHMQAGRYFEAQLCCQQALEVNPDHAETLHLVGLVHFHCRRFDHAVEWLARAIRKDPKPAYLATLGTTLANQGRFEEALKAFNTAIQLNPDDADLWRNLGNVLVDADRKADAILSFQHALKLDPQHWDAAQKAAVLLSQLERFDEAIVHFDICDKLQPNHAQLLCMRALTLQKLKRFGEALADYTRAAALDPANADACNDIGNVLRSLGRHEEATTWYDRCLELRPNFAVAVANKAVSLAELRRFDEAFAAYRRATAIDPSHAATDWNLALLQMLTGDFEAGWAGREARWKIPALSAHYPNFPNRCGLETSRSPARPSWSLRMKDWAMQFSSRAMSRWWRREVRVSFSWFTTRYVLYCRD